MSTTIKFKRGTQAAVEAYSQNAELGEPIFDIERKRLFIGTDTTIEEIGGDHFSVQDDTLDDINDGTTYGKVTNLDLTSNRVDFDKLEGFSRSPSSPYGGLTEAYLNQLVDGYIGIHGWKGITISDTTSGEAIHILDSISDGIKIDNALSNAIRIVDSGNNAISIINAGNHGIVIANSTVDGIRITTAGSDAIQVTNATYHGLSIANAGSHGVNIATATNNAINISTAGGYALKIANAGTDAIHIDDAGDNAIEIENSTSHGILIDTAGADGIHITTATDNAIEINNAGANGLLVTDSTNDAIHITNSGTHGVNIETAGSNAINVTTATTNGLQILNAGNHGIMINDATSDGIRILTAGNYGIQITNATVHALNIVNAGSHGVNIATATNNAINISDSGNNAIKIDDSASHAILITTTTAGDAIHVANAASNAIEIENASSHGIFITTSGGDSIHIDGATDNAIQIDGAGTNGLLVTNATGDAIQINNAGANGIEIQDAGNYGIDLGKCTTSGYGPLYIENAGVAGAANLHTTYNNAAIDAFAVDSNHDLYIKTGASTWSLVGASAASAGIVDSSVISGTSTSSSAVVIDQDGLTMRNAGGNVRFDINEDGSWTLGNSGGDYIDFTNADVLSINSATLSSCSISGEQIDSGTVAAARIADLSATYAVVALGVTNGNAHDHSGGDGAQINHTTLSNIGANSHATIDSHISATTAHGATGAVMGTTNTQSVENKSLEDLTTWIYYDGGVTKKFRFSSFNLTPGANQVFYLPNVASSDTVVCRADTATLTNKTMSGGTVSSATLSSCSISGEQIDSGTVAAARIANLDASKITTGTFDRDTFTTGSMTMEGGETLDLEAGASHGELQIVGSSYTTSLYSSAATGSSVTMNPSTTGVVDLSIGTSSYQFEDINVYGDFLYLRSYYDIYFYVNNSSTMGVTIDNADNMRPVSSSETMDLGTSTNGWDQAYANNWGAPAEFAYMDKRKDLDTGEEFDVDDLGTIESIKSRGEYSERNGFMLIDDSTIPEWLIHRNHKTKEKEYNTKGQPIISLNTWLALAFGAIRQLNNKIKQQAVEIETLKSK